MKPAPYEIDVKRFYLPIKIRRKCPKCGEMAVRDLSESYLSYPTVGEPFDVDMNHWEKRDGTACGEEWTVPMVLNVTLARA